MSDYLWDKTGEADEETRRLEELLGGLKFQPRPLQLPALPAHDFRAARTRSLLSWPRLAVAASLTAALLLGAWLVMNERRVTRSETPQMARAVDTMPAKKKDEAPPAATPEGADDKTPNNGGDKQPQSNISPAGTPRQRNAAMQARPRRPNLARGPERMTRMKQPEQREEIPSKFTDEEIAAAEKVMFALRLTSEKLSYARQQVQDAGRREGNR